MAKIIKPLTDTEIKTAKSKNREYTLHNGDGDGLQLIVTNKDKNIGNLGINGHNYFDMVISVYDHISEFNNS